MWFLCIIDMMRGRDAIYKLGVAINQMISLEELLTKQGKINEEISGKV